MLKLFILVAVFCAAQAQYGQQYPADGSQPMPSPVYPQPPAPKPQKCDMSVDYTNVVGSCTEFRRCSNGYLWILRCPYNTVWDNKARTCARPDLVSGPCGTMKQEYQQAYPVPSVYPTQPTQKPSYPVYTTTTTTTTKTTTPVTTTYSAY